MRQLLLLAAALSALTSTVAAQPDTPAVSFPLAVGNQWTYAVLTSAGEAARYVRWSVEAAITDSTYRLHGDALDLSGVVTGAFACTAEVRGNGGNVTWYQFQDGECDSLPGVIIPFSGGVWVPAEGEPGEVTIGGQTVLTTTFHGWDKSTMGGIGYEVMWFFGWGIGPVQYRNTRISMGGSFSGITYRLDHAIVGGVVYGTVVAMEPVPVGTALAVAVAPNPVRGAAVLSVALPAAADVEAAIYDVMGRRVLTLDAGALSVGHHRLTLDAGRLAPGVYVVRVRAGSATATARLVRAE